MFDEQHSTLRLAEGVALVKLSLVCDTVCSHAGLHKVLRCIDIMLAKPVWVLSKCTL